MKVYRSIQEFSATNPRKVCLAIGFFDGVHLGHQQIIRQTTSDAHRHNAQAVVLTFNRHPASVVAPQRAPALIYSLPQKLRTIASFSPESLLLLKFDREFSEQPPETFVRQLAPSFGQIQSVCVGANFLFGHKRAGNVQLLKQLGQELNFTVHGIAAVSLDDKPVSSTRVRELIAAGDLEEVSELLGREYSLASTVVHGDHLGHQLGFPTANLDIEGLCCPPNGVYAAHAQVVSTDRRGARCASVTNIGVRPTVKQPRPTKRLEVHLLDFSEDLYGKELEVTFLRKLRDEQKFANLDELRAQIGRDIESARKVF